MPEITSRRAWRRAVLQRDRRRCRWCGSAVEVGTHHVREVSRWPALALDLANGLALCWSCHYYEAHHGHPNFVDGRFARSRRPLPGQLELFARWPGSLFAGSRAVKLSDSDNSITPPIGSVWPGPQRLLFGLETGLFARVR